MRRFAAAAVAALMVTSQAGAAEVKDLAAEGKALIQKFGGTLKGELQAAMKDGGPVAAIEVCNVRAPEIGAQVAAESDGWFEFVHGFRACP